MRKTKEFLTHKGLKSQDDALAQLFETMLLYLRNRDGAWKWLKQPETAQHNGAWRAYARIEFL